MPDPRTPRQWDVSDLDHPELNRLRTAIAELAVSLETSGHLLEDCGDDRAEGFGDGELDAAKLIRAILDPPTSASGGPTQQETAKETNQ